MMSKCPECGSTEIIPDLIFYGYTLTALQPASVGMMDPSKKSDSLANRVSASFRVAVCGSCGHTEMYTRAFEDLLVAYKKGFVTREP